MWLDDMIGVFSPRRKLQRVKARAQALQFEKALGLARKYEAASRSRRTEGWISNSTSANAEIVGSLSILRNRSRDLVRNNPHAKSGINVIKTEVVGKGIRANVKGPAGAQKSFMEKWDQWTETTACDFDGKKNFYALQRLIIGTIAESGEVLVRRRFVANSEFPMKLQVLEPDYLVNDMVGVQIGEGNQVSQGIEVNSKGQVVAYHLYEEHPGNNFGINFSLKSAWKTVRVPADEIIHLYNVDRAGQLRGVPWLAAVMLKLRDFDDYEDAQLLRQKIAACFAAFITDTDIAEEPTTDEESEALGDKLEPGIIQLLPPGKSVTFGNPPPVDGYGDFSATTLRAIAVGLGISYEALTGDLSRVNFSSGRMGHLKMQANIEVWRQELVISGFCDPVFNWFKDSLFLVGLNSTKIWCSWIAPRREMIDPTKEVPARIEAIRAGLESLEDSVLQNGKDPEDHFAQLAETNKTLDRLGLVLDSDPRKDQNSSKIKAKASDSESDDSSDENETEA